MLARELGERIRARREGLGLTQRDVAGALQVSNQAVSKWERGENAPDVGVLGALGRLLGVSLDWLLGAPGREGEVFEATVFLSDVRGFARRLAALSERDGVAWLNGLLAQVTEPVLRHDGVPVKYVGDSLLAFFAGPGHRERAVRAALLAKAVAGAPLAVGLHSGPVYFGKVGHAAYARPDLVGPTLVVTARTHHWAGATRSRLAATAAVVAGVDAPDLAAVAGAAQAVELKGLDAPVLLHELRPPVGQPR